MKPRLDNSWSFNNIPRRQTSYASHGYHRYPAKFIPQLVEKLLLKYSKPNDYVLDPFGGCGTTLVESTLNGRNSVGLDINQTAVMISRAKTKPVNPQLLRKRNRILLNKIERGNKPRNYYPYASDRLKYWFKKKHYNQLMGIYKRILKEQNSNLRLFYICCFSHILKHCSKWYSKSVKPMRDYKKNIQDPVNTFKQHLKFMTQRNEDFYSLVESKSLKNISCRTLKGDARNMMISDNYFDLIITSPPYVTSYEYADLHQLSTLWLEPEKDFSKMRKRFIGTSQDKDQRRQLSNSLVSTIVSKLHRKDRGLARRIENYYSDLFASFKEMHRVLKKDKHLTLVLGDTVYKGIKIKNCSAATEYLKSIGFKIKKVIKRKLSSKIFTPFRDIEGKFASAMNSLHKVYQYEYVIIAQKK